MVALLWVTATGAAAAQMFAKSQTLTYPEGATVLTAVNFGVVMAASGNKLAVLASSIPPGGSLNVPFPGQCCGAFVYQVQSQRWEPVAVLYEEINRALPAGSVALSGSRLVHGIPNYTSPAGSSAGGVWTYVADPEWHREAEIQSPEPRAGAFFGTQVALDGDTLAALATGSGGVPSAIHVYSFADATWNLVQTVRPPASFTTFLAMVMNREWLAATSHEKGGAAFLYRRGSEGWELRQTLLPPSGGSFGGQVLAITADMLAVASAPESVGRVYVYKLAGGLWSLTQQLDPSDRTECTYLGNQISMTSHKLLVGASRACVNGKQNAGLVRLYLRTNDTWTKAADFTDDTPEAYESFGAGVAAGANHAFMNSGISESNFTAWKVDVFVAPADPSTLRRRAVHR